MIRTILIVSMAFMPQMVWSRNAGIVVACCEKYAMGLYASLRILRQVHGCTLPIEVWFAGDELSEKAKEMLSAIGQVSFHDIAERFGGDPKQYRGYHIKGFALFASHFDELILMDADVVFYQDPQKLLDHPKMRERGAYFFRDREDFKFHSFNQDQVFYGDRYFTSRFTYEQRREIFLHLIPEVTESIPEDWRHYWLQSPSRFDHPIPSEHQDAGCVAIDKTRAPVGCGLILKLNQFRNILYKYILGDKETYWLALASAKETFAVNPTHPYRLKTKSEEREMFHFLDDAPFFLQKTPIGNLKQRMKLVPTGKLAPRRVLSNKEIRWLCKICNRFNHYQTEYEKG